MPQTVATD